MDTALTRHRLFLLIGAVAIPLLGVARLFVKPGFPDPMWLRAVLTGLFVAALASSYRFVWVRERIHEITLILCHIVQVQSLLGEGSTFTVLLPAAIGSKQST